MISDGEAAGSTPEGEGFAGRNPPAGRRRFLTWRRVLVVVTVLVLAVGAGVWWGFFRSPTLGDLQAVADEFSPPSDWTLIDEAARDRAPLCIDVTCPSVFRRWGAEEPPSRDELERLMVSAGWDEVDVDGMCRPLPNTTGPHPICEATATSGGVDIRVSVAGPITETPPPFWIVLSVEP